MADKHNHDYSGWELQPTFGGKAFVQRVCKCGAKITTDLLPRDEADEFLWAMVSKALG